MQRVLWIALACLLSFPARSFSQSAGNAIAREGSSQLATNPTFPASKDLVYRIAWGVNVGPSKPDSIVPGFRSAANFLYVADANAVPRANIHQAVVVWGSATHSLLKNEAYKTARGADNASIPLLQALHDAGVQIIVCGEALLNRKLSRDDLLPFVKVAPTATMALATLHAQGYAIFRP